MTNYVVNGDGLFIANSVGSVTINHDAVNDAETNRIIKEARSEATTFKPTDCKQCKWAILGPCERTQVREDGTIVIMKAAEGSTTCGKESVHGMSIINGEICCNDFEENRYKEFERGECT